LGSVYIAGSDNSDCVIAFRHAGESIIAACVSCVVSYSIAYDSILDRQEGAGVGDHTGNGAGRGAGERVTNNFYLPSVKCCCKAGEVLDFQFPCADGVLTIERKQAIGRSCICIIPGYNIINRTSCPVMQDNGAAIWRGNGYSEAAGGGAGDINIDVDIGNY